jgi:hypothetical protein
MPQITFRNGQIFSGMRIHDTHKLSVFIKWFCRQGDSIRVFSTRDCMVKVMVTIQQISVSVQN